MLIKGLRITFYIPVINPYTAEFLERNNTPSIFGTHC